MRWVKQQVKRVLTTANYLGGSYQDKLLIIGDGRTGTNWLIDLLNVGKRRRLIYEPFHGWEFRPKLAAEYPDVQTHGSSVLTRQFNKAARGAFITKNVTIEFPHWRYDGLLIKDINAQLMIDELDAAIPGMRKVLIMRHPFAVALSKSKYRGHHWPTSPADFLAADTAFARSLEPQRAVIEQAQRSDDRIVQLICVWCILHKALFSSTTIQQYQVVFYEHLATNAYEICETLYADLGLETQFAENRAALAQIISQRSRVTEADNAIDASTQGRAAWKDALPPATISTGLEILGAFELDRIYAEDHFPRVGAAQVHDVVQAGAGR